MLYYIGKCVKNVMRLKAKDKKFLLASAVKIAVFAGIGAAAGAGSLRYSIILQQRQNQALLAQAIQAPPEKKTASPAAVPAETQPAETASDTPVYEPAPDKLNLAYFYPEDKNTGDMIDSYAGQVFSDLTIQDSQWLADLYELADVAPEEMAVRLGKDSASILGSYNPNKENQDPKDPSTWKIDSWKRIQITFTDGDGRQITGFSNVKDILAMASVYTYYTGMMDADTFSAYAHDLWDASHSYTLGISDVYYCDGCLDKTEEELAMEAEAEEEAAAAMLSPKEQLISEKDSSNLPSKETLSLNETLQETQSPEESLPAETASEAARPEIAKGSEEAPLVIHHENSSEPWETPSGQTALEEAQEASPSVMASSSDAASPLSLSEEPGQLLDEPLSAEEEDSACPGHVDLQIQVRILGINDKHGLFSIDQTGNTPDLENGWEGWTEENQNFANSIAQQDWFADYGLSVSSLSLSDPLSHEEIEEYMAALPANLSETRREIIRFALNSVGKVPYYWGGKASYPNYEGNRFGSLVPADDQGRILKGLDCSGWISWVYWSVTGTKLEAQSTSSLILCGQEISRSELQPGDIVVRTGANAHVVMFLGWSADGKMNVIHESSASVNNVTLKTMEAAWPYYRKLVD